ncbi:MAG: hypothetical protein IKN25_09095 [Spirochaetales bacterium]|nr:hypothetical protein [Spirochaetales bacterium]
MMEKRDIENELKELQNKLDTLKQDVQGDEKKAILPIINQLEESALSLKAELYRKITPIERV